MYMGRAWITDYIDDPSIERQILADELASEPSDEIEVLLVWHEDVGASYIDRFPRLKSKGARMNKIAKKLVSTSCPRMKNGFPCET